MSLYSVTLAGASRPIIVTRDRRRARRVLAECGLRGLSPRLERRPIRRKGGKR